MKNKQTGIMANAGITVGPDGQTKSLSDVQNAKKVQRPGMEQFVNAIRLNTVKDKVLLCLPKGFLLPEVLR